MIAKRAMLVLLLALAACGTSATPTVPPTVPLSPTFLQAAATQTVVARNATIALVARSATQTVVARNATIAPVARSATQTTTVPPLPQATATAATPTTTQAPLSPPGGGGVLAYDTFTAADGTLVTARRGDSGHGWVMQAGAFDATPFVITNNRARSQVGGTNVGLLDYTPPTDYEIVAKLYRHSSGEWGLWGRASDAASSGYSLFWSGTRFDLYRYVSGSGTLLGNSDEHASGLSLSDGTLYWVKVRYQIVSGNVAVTAWLRADAAGEDTYTLLLDVTDSHADRHTAAGRAGLNLRNTGASTGMHTAELRVQAVGTPDGGAP